MPQPTLDTLSYELIDMDISKIIGLDEVAQFSFQHEYVYFPQSCHALSFLTRAGLHSAQKTVDPSAAWKSQAYSGKVVIITGGATGVGGASATAYARAGADLVLVGRRKDRLEEKKAEIIKELPNARIEVVAGDIGSPEVPKLAVEAAVKAFGRVDIALANAGTGAPPIHRTHIMVIVCSQYAAELIRLHRYW